MRYRWPFLSASPSLWHPPLERMTFFSPNGRSIALATMLQTNHCLLYLSVSFTHLKRSTDSAPLIARKETCPFPLRLVCWKTKKMDCAHTGHLSCPGCHLCMCLCSMRRVGESVIFSYVSFFPSRARTCAPALAPLYCHSLQSERPVRCFTITPATARPLWRSNERLLPSLGVCAKHDTGRCRRGEVATAAAIEVGEEWRLRIRVFKHQVSCAARALIWAHLGTGCSASPITRAAKERAEGDSEIQNLVLRRRRKPT